MFIIILGKLGFIFGGVVVSNVLVIGGFVFGIIIIVSFIVFFGGFVFGFLFIIKISIINVVGVGFVFGI